MRKTLVVLAATVSLVATMSGPSVSAHPLDGLGGDKGPPTVHDLMHLQQDDRQPA